MLLSFYLATSFHYLNLIQNKFVYFNRGLLCYSNIADIAKIIN